MHAGGGQPVAMENLKAAAALCKKYDVFFYLDACRFAENSYFVRSREPGEHVIVGSSSNSKETRVLKELWLIALLNSLLSDHYPASAQQSNDLGSLNHLCDNI